MMSEALRRVKRNLRKSAVPFSAPEARQFQLGCLPLVGYTQLLIWGDLSSCFNGSIAESVGKKFGETERPG
jgi:hypothetical protein